MQQWEYMNIDITQIFVENRMDGDLKEKLLNTFGEQGWEFVAVDDGMMYFKRPITTSPNK